MSSNYSVNVPKLRGRDNYDEWAFAAENYMIIEGVILGGQNVLTEAENNKAKAKLIMTIDPSLYTHIKNEASVQNLWTKLKSLFDDSGFTRKISLLRSLISIRLETSDSMTSYVSQLVETAQKLNGTGFDINDEWVGSLLLAGLPEKFSPMIMAIEHSGMKISCDTIKTKLLDMSSDFEGNSESAFIAQKRGKPPSGNGMQTSVGNVKANNNNPKNKKRVIRCYTCKKVGHYKNQCTSNEQINGFSAVFLTNGFEKTDWYVDSGASTHMVSDKNLLYNISYQPITKEIVVANQNSVQVECSGDLDLTTSVQGSEHRINVKNVLCVPNLTTNLLSVSRIVENGNRVSFNKNGCYIFNAKNDCIGEASLENNVYKLNIVKSKQVLAAVVQTSSTTWHRRMGHINSNDLEKMKHGAVYGVSYQDKCCISKANCVVCCEGKQVRLPFPLSSSKASESLELVHTDLCGPMEHKSLSKSRYYLLLMDDHSRMCFVYFLKTKDETFKYFQEFKNLVENQKSRKIKTIRSDNGGEYISTEMEKYLKDNGIIHQKTVPYTPEQNGRSERFNRSIVEKSRCLLFDAQLNKELWAEAVNTAVYLSNRSPKACLGKNTTPYEIWTGKKPNLSHLRVFGSPVMVHIPKEKRKKWDKKANMMYLVGYSENIKGYRLYNPNNQTLTVARDVVVMENIQNNSNTTSIMVKDPEPLQNIIREESSEEQQEVQDEIGQEGDDDYVVSESSSEIEELDETLTTDDMDVANQSNVNQPDKRVRRQPDFYGIANMCVEDMTCEPITVNDAMNGPEMEQWRKAMKEELQSFSDNNTWELVNRPSEGTVVKNKWVFKKKCNSEGEVRYRARLVAKGFTQVKGVDFSETFSPVVRYCTLRMLFALSLKFDLKMNHLDVPTAFLNGHLEESVFIEIPEFSEYFNCSNKVLKLNKAMYGLKQSARAWYTRVEESLLKLGFSKSSNEPCLFMKIHDNVKVYVALFVDDFFVFYNCNTTYRNLKVVLEKEYKIKDLGQIKQCLGMNVNVNKNCIKIDQEQFVNRILTRFNMSDCKTTDTPMETNLKLEKDETCDEKFPYQQLIGCLMYLSVLTRPDISFSVSFLSQYNMCFNQTHWNHLKRLLKYLQKTKKYGLVFKKSDTNLHGYVDANWGSCSLDRRSYTGYSFILSGCVISYESRKQRTVALSSTEAEYMALSEACKEAIYLQNLMVEMGVLDSKVPICLFSDNQSSIKLSANPLFHKRTKHIDIRHHFVRDCVVNKKIQVEYVSTSNMPADILTKSLCANKHYKFMSSLGISEV